MRDAFEEATDEIARLRPALAQSVQRVRELIVECDALQARIDRAPVVTMKQLAHGIVPGDYAVLWDWNEARKRVALVVLEDGK